MSAMPIAGTLNVMVLSAGADAAAEAGADADADAEAGSEEASEDGFSFTGSGSFTARSI